MTTVLEAPATHQNTPIQFAAGEWLEVVSHLQPRYGGLSTAVPALALSMGEQGARTSVAAFCAPGENYNPPGIYPGQLSFWPTGRKAWLRSDLRQSFKRTIAKSAGVHIHGLWEQSTAMAAHVARAEDVPYIISAHGMLEPWALANKRLKKLIYSLLIERRNIANADCLHALTAAEALQYVRFGARAPIAIIPNGVSIPDNVNPQDFRDHLPILGDRRIVLFLARLHRKKGLDVLIDAWSSIAEKWPDACLVLAGPDSEGTQARLEAKVTDNRMQSSVFFAGMLDARMKWSALAAATGFVLPSYSEGFSMGVLEALGMGLPVIVTEQCNMPEVESSRAGWQIQPDVAQLTFALDQLLSTSDTQNACMGQRGADLVRDRYSWSGVSSQMARLYGWLQGGDKPSSLNLVYP